MGGIAYLVHEALEDLSRRNHKLVSLVVIPADVRELDEEALLPPGIVNVPTEFLTLSCQLSSSRKTLPSSPRPA
jgi:hypothetical protein